MNRMFVTCSLVLLVLSASASALAGVKVTSLDFIPRGSLGYVNVGLEGRSSALPDLHVAGNTITLTVKKANPFSSISRDVRGAKLSANNSGESAVITVTLPYDVPTNGVSVGWNQNIMEISFPRGKARSAAPVAAAPLVAPAAPETVKPTKVTKETLNENYLNRIMEESSAQTAETPEKAQASTATIADELTVKQAAPEQTRGLKDAGKSDSFSFAGYAAKFTGFLLLVLGLFYGVVQLLKRGVFNRGKLGFLNNSQLIQVLSTTYVSPKRSLLVVKAHNQIFLVANSENGLQFLSEMKDTPGLLKEGERLITGANFDTDLSAQAELDAAVVKLKEDILTSTPVEEPVAKKFSPAKDIVRFSDELKKKAKNLRPIDFN